MHLHSDPITWLETQVQLQQSIFNLHSLTEPKKMNTHTESGLLGAEDKAVQRANYISEVQRFRRKNINKCKNKYITCSS